jgi:chromate reductase, NAD(P)H dehydrogenase (quinone)
MNVLAMCASLRKASWNRMLLNNTVRLAPDDISFDVYEGLRDLPHYDQDFEQNLPGNVRDLKRRVAAADAVLFVTPEFNHSVPGVLKNAIDWLSRPQSENNLDGKPVAVFGCGGSTFGAVRMHIAFREILWSVGAETLPKFELILFKASERFDADGVLTDLVTMDGIARTMSMLKERVAARSR